ncbi:MAG TPA: type I-B CRISPR-associated protein Cas7/Csh2 [Ignavibacteria bacterium]|mgnify:CR=1 FL=1|nr:type I-B CRISPR-associated protein Cas7/Csh2 [Ignavibacteria bacterium]
MENLAKQSELLFIWDAKMCNPNGDMSADNAPRFDDVDEKAIVSDVRIKRTIRDDLQHRKEKEIYINNDVIVEKGLKAEERFKELKNKLKDLDDKGVFLSCIDNRLFGGVAPKSGIQLVGTVQFSWTKSLNKTETILKRGTGAFVTEKEEKKDESEEIGRFQKTFRVDNYIPYGLFAMYGTINRLQAIKANTSEIDVEDMLDSLWLGTKLLNTRSKEGQKPRMLIRIIYKEASGYFIGLLDELVSLKNTDSEMIRNVNEAEMDFGKLIGAINKAEGYIEKVEIVIDDSMTAYKEELNQIQKVKLVDEMQFLKCEG